MLIAKLAYTSLRILFLLVVMTTVPHPRLRPMSLVDAAPAPSTIGSNSGPSSESNGHVLPISLYQSVVLALQNNMDVKLERLTPLIREEEVRREAGVFFSPQVNFDTSADRAQKPTGTVLAGAQVLETQNVDLNTGVSMRSSTGGIVSLDFRNKRFESNSAFQVFDPQYIADLALNVTHPLLKNFGIGVNTTRIKLAQNSAQMSKYQLKSVVTNLISDVQHAYWELVMARHDLAARRRSVEVTQYLHKRTEEMVGGGRLPAIAILQAKSAVLEREIDVVTAENALEDAQERLKSLLNLRSIAAPSGLTIMPLDSPVFPIQPVSSAEGLKSAQANRPELFQARLDQENRGLAVTSAKNQMLPEVNFVGSVGLSGLSGAPTSLPFADLTIGGIPVETFIARDPSSFDGGYDVALSKLFSGNFVSYKVGLSIQIPLGNQSARSELARSRLEAEKARGVLQSLEEKIALEVDRAARTVNSAVKAIEGMKSLRELAERRLQMAQDGFALGVSSVTDVLEAEKTLTLAQRDEVRVLIDYQKRRVLWEKVTGEALERFQITL
jgi:outer membrane protein